MSDGPKLATNRWAPSAIAVATYAVGFALGYFLVRDDLVWMCGPEPVCIWHSGPWKFWLTMPVFPAGIAWFVAFRKLNGPAVEREQLALFFAPPGEVPTLQALADGLISAGYPVRVHRVDGALTAGAAATGMEPLLGSDVVVEDSTVKARRAHLRLMLAPAGGRGTGILDIVDTKSGHYARLASAALLALSRQLPDLKFRRLDSSLAPTPAASCSPARAPWAGV